MLGECPVWCELDQALYWTDIDGARLHRWRPSDREREVWEMPSSLGCFALCDAPGLVLLGLAQEVALYDLARRQILQRQAIDLHGPRVRLNDGACDAQGRFVFGTFDPQERALGPFWRIGPGLALERLALPLAAIANSIAFSPDGGELYFTDSPSRVLMRVTYGADGPLGAPEVFAQLEPGDDVPDGSSVDAEGCLWNARWGGGCVVRHAPDGRVLERHALPAQQLTHITFGGPELRTAFITSAAKQLKPADVEAQCAGAVFALNLKQRGLPARRFATR